MTIVLRIFALLIAIRALTDVFKPFGAGSTFVFFGAKLANTNPLGPLMGIYMLVYVYGLWRKQAWAVPMGVAYAIFATLNIVLFYLLQELPEGVTGFRYLIFAVVGIGVSWGSVVLLRRELGQS